MALLGSAALAMWWDMAPAMRPEFEDWHSHEHFRERLGIPGFLRATRWTAADGGEGIFQCYELQAYETLASAPYLARLNAPSAWSTRLMPHHRHMVRTQCRVLATHGAGTAAFALTVRLSPSAGGAMRLQQGLDTLLAALVDRPGLAGGHLLQHQAPAIAATTEQKLRGHDAVADWVLLVTGYDADVLQALAASELAAPALEAMGAAAGSAGGLYRLSLTATPADLADCG